MRLTDGLILTLINTIVCVTLPKILSSFSQPQRKQEQSVTTPTSSDREIVEILAEARPEVHSY